MQCPPRPEGGSGSWSRRCEPHSEPCPDLCKSKVLNLQDGSPAADLDFQAFLTASFDTSGWKSGTRAREGREEARLSVRKLVVAGQAEKAPGAPWLQSGGD